MGRKVKIFPSILSADFSRLAEEIAVVESAGADGIHLDVMDGHFVPNISYGPPVIRSIRKTTSLPFWAHLMIEEPGKYVEAFHDVDVQGITIHCEIDEDWIALSDRIHDLGMEAGVAVNPETPLTVIEDVLHRFDLVLIMTVHPGFGGQSFMEEPVRKIAALRRMADSLSKPFLIAVDGGMNMETASVAAEAGVDLLVAGSSIFGDDDPAEALRALRAVSEEGS